MPPGVLTAAAAHRCLGEMAAVASALEISEATQHRWRNQSGGMKAEDAKEPKQLRVENPRLGRMVADRELQIEMLWDVATGKG